MLIRPTSRINIAQTVSGYEVFREQFPEFVGEIIRLRARREYKLARLATMPRRAQHGEVRKLLRSGSLHLLYAFEAIKAKRQLRTATPETVKSVTQMCDPFRSSNELITSRYVSKGRTARIVQDYGPIRRMRQLLVADLLRTIHPPRQDQFLFNGGMPMALRAVEAAFRNGFTHAIEVDLIDFYGGVRHPGLANMLRPLPGAVTDHVIWDFAARRSFHDVLYDIGMVSPTASGLVGLSLGAATSPIVGEIIISHLLDAAQLSEVVTYADNILVLGRGMNEVVMKAKHLREVASRLEIGPLALRIDEPAGFRDRDNWVDFAGHEGRAIGHRLDWAPNHRKQQQHRIADFSSMISEQAIAEAERKVSHCRRAYPMWRTARAWETQRLAELAAVRYYQNAQPQHLADAQQKLAIAYLTGNGLELCELLPDGTIERHRHRRMELLRETEQLLENLRPQVLATAS